MGKQDKSVVWEVTEEEGSSPSYGRSVVHAEQETKEARTSWELLSEEKEDEELFFVQVEADTHKMEDEFEMGLEETEETCLDWDCKDDYLHLYTPKINPQEKAIVRQMDKIAEGALVCIMDPQDENSRRQLDKIVEGALGCSPYRLTDTETRDGYSGMLAEEKDEEPGLSKSPKDDKSVFSWDCSVDFSHGQITFEYSLPSVPETYPQLFPYHASVGGDHPCAQSASTGSDIASGPSDNVNSLMIRSAANSSAAFRAEVDLHIESKELNQRSLKRLVGPLVEPLIPTISIDRDANLTESENRDGVSVITAAEDIHASKAQRESSMQSTGIIWEPQREDILFVGWQTSANWQTSDNSHPGNSRFQKAIIQNQSYFGAASSSQAELDVVYDIFNSLISTGSRFLVRGAGKFWTMLTPFQARQKIRLALESAWPSAPYKRPAPRRKYIKENGVTSISPKFKEWKEEQDAHRHNANVGGRTELCLPAVLRQQDQTVKALELLRYRDAKAFPRRLCEMLSTLETSYPPLKSDVHAPPPKRA